MKDPASLTQHRPIHSHLQPAALGLNVTSAAASLSSGNWSFASCGISGCTINISKRSKPHSTLPAVVIHLLSHWNIVHLFCLISLIIRFQSPLDWCINHRGNNPGRTIVLFYNSNTCMPMVYLLIVKKLSIMIQWIFFPNKLNWLYC